MFVSPLWFFGTLFFVLLGFVFWLSYNELKNRRGGPDDDPEGGIPFIAPELLDPDFTPSIRMPEPTEEDKEEEDREAVAA